MRCHIAKNIKRHQAMFSVKYGLISLLNVVHSFRYPNAYKVNVHIFWNSFLPRARDEIELSCYLFLLFCHTNGAKWQLYVLWQLSSHTHDQICLYKFWRTNAEEQQETDEVIHHHLIFGNSNLFPWISEAGDQTNEG